MVDLYRADERIATLGEQDALNGLDVLPGFTCDVSAVFGHRLRRSALARSNPKRERRLPRVRPLHLPCHSSCLWYLRFRLGHPRGDTPR